MSTLQRLSTRRKRPRNYIYRNPFGRQITKKDIATNDNHKPILTGPYYGRERDGHRDLMVHLRCRGTNRSGLTIDEDEYYLLNELNLTHRQLLLPFKSIIY